MISGIKKIGLVVLIIISAILASPAGISGEEHTAGNIIWEFEVPPIQSSLYPGENERETFSPAVWNGRVYLFSNDHNIYCLDAGTGKMIWKFKFQYRSHQHSYCPLIYDGRLYFCAGYLYCLDATTGKKYWNVKAKSEVNKIPAIYDSKLYISGKRLHCFDAKSGKHLWEYRDSMGDEFVMSPTVYKDKVYSSTGQTMYCFNRLSGGVIWKQKLGRKNDMHLIGAYPGAYNGQIFVASDKGYFYSLDAETGYVLKTVLLSMSSLNIKALAFSGDAVLTSYELFVPPKQKYVVMSPLNARKGESFFIAGTNEFFYQLPGSYYSVKSISSPSVSDGRAYVCVQFENDNKEQSGLFCLDIKSENILWQKNIAVEYGYTIIHEGRIYVGTPTHLYCIDAGDPKAGGWTMFGGGSELGGYNRLEK